MTVSLIIAVLIVLACGCSKDKPENAGNSGNSEGTNAAGSAEPAKDTAMPVPSQAEKPAEEGKADTGNGGKDDISGDFDAGKDSSANDSDIKDASMNSGNSGAGMEAAGTNLSEEGENAGSGNTEKEYGNTGVDVQDATGTPEPIETDDEKYKGRPNITDSPDPVDSYEDDILDMEYTDFSGTDEEAAHVAEVFANAYLLGDGDAVMETIACDEDVKDQLAEDLKLWTGYSNFFGSYLATGDITISDVDMEGLLGMKIVGGTGIDKQEALEWIEYYDTYVADLSEWDNYQVFSAAFEGLYARAVSDYESEGLNVIVAEKNGEYKVVTVEFYELEEVQADPEEIKALIEENKYAFNGDESAEDIANLYKEAFENYDFFKMFSVIAIDEEHEAEAYLDNEYLYFSFELCKHMKPGMVSISVTRSEAEQVSEDEWAEAMYEYFLVNDVESITDVVKYEFSVRMMEAGEEFLDEYAVYIGKFNGAFRVIDSHMFE